MQEKIGKIQKIEKKKSKAGKIYYVLTINGTEYHDFLGAFKNAKKGETVRYTYRLSDDGELRFINLIENEEIDEEPEEVVEEEENFEDNEEKDVPDFEPQSSKNRSFAMAYAKDLVGEIFSAATPKLLDNKPEDMKMITATAKIIEAATESLVFVYSVIIGKLDE